MEFPSWWPTTFWGHVFFYVPTALTLFATICISQFLISFGWNYINPDDPDRPAIPNRLIQGTWSVIVGYSCFTQLGFLRCLGFATVSYFLVGILTPFVFAPIIATISLLVYRQRQREEIETSAGDQNPYRSPESNA